MSRRLGCHRSKIAPDQYPKSCVSQIHIGLIADIGCKFFHKNSNSFISVGFFKCEKDGFCIPEERKCDKVPHCSDGSDEDEKLNCETIEIGKSELCAGNYTECFDSSNVTICAKKCDGDRECAYEDDEDEKICGNDSKVRTATITPKIITSEKFPEKYQNDYIWSVIIKSYDCQASIVLKIYELYIEQDDEFRENGSILCYDYLLWFEGEKSAIDFQLNPVRKFSNFTALFFHFAFFSQKFLLFQFVL